MSTTIDNKVVEMSFDNTNFEKNVKVSLGTLDRLKEALNFDHSKDTFKNLENAANNVDLSGIERGVEALQERFSTLGIVGIEILKKLTNAALDLGSKLVKNTIGKIISGGYARSSNLQAAKFMLEGLDVEWKDILEDIEYGVNDTAYSLDAAAKVASSLVASGISIGDEMKTSLRGISGVAAMTNSSYEEIGQIFTTVAGQGKLMTMQLRQLELRGMNAAATIGKYLGVTESEVRDMVTKGVIDFETFSQAMDDAFGEHAKASNETLTGVLANIGSALSRIGQRFIEPIIRNNGPLIEFLNAVRVGINEVNAGLEFLSDAVNPKVDSALQNLADKATGLLSGYNRFSLALNKTGMSMNGFRTNLENLYKDQGKYGKFEEAIKGTKAYKDKIDKLSEAIETYQWHDSLSMEQMEALGLTVDDLAKEYDTLIDSFGGEDAEAAFASFLKNQDISEEHLSAFIQGTDAFKQSLSSLGMESSDVATVLFDQYYALKDLNDEQLKAEGYTREQVEALHELAQAFARGDENAEQMLEDMINGGTVIENIMGGLKGIFEGIKPVIKAIAKAFKDIFGSKNRKSLREITKRFKEFGEEFGEKLAKNADKIGRAFSGLFAILDLLSELVKGALTLAFKVLGAIFGSTAGGVLDLAANTGDLLTNFHDMVLEGGYIEKAFDKIADVLVSLIDKIKSVVKWFKNLTGLDFETIKDNISSLGSTIKDFFDSLDFKTPLKDIFEPFNKSINDTDTNSSSKLKNISDNVSGFVSNIKEALSNMFGNSGDKIVALGSVLALIIIFDKLAKAIQLVADMIPSLGNLEKALTDLLNVLTNSVKKLARAKQFEIITEGIYNLAKALLVLTISLAILSKLEYGSGNILSGLVSLAGILLLLLATSVVISKVAEAVSVKSVIAVSAIIFALVPMGIAMALFSVIKIDFVKLLSNLGKLLLILGTLAGVFALIKFIGSKFEATIINDILLLTAIPLALNMFVRSLRKMSKINLDEDAISNIGKVLLLFLSLVLIIKKIAKDTFSLSASILLLVLSVGLLSIFVKSFKNLKFSKNAEGIVIGLITVCTLLYALFKFINKTVVKEVVKTSGALLEIAGCILLLTFAVRILKGIDFKSAMKAVGEVGILLMALGIMLRIAGKEVKAARATIVAVGILIAEIAAIIFAMTLIDDQGRVALAAGIVAGVLVALGFLLQGVAKLSAASGKNIAKAFGMLFGVTVIVAMLSAIVIGLCRIVGADEALKVCEGLAVLLISLAGTVGVLGLIGKFIKVGAVAEGLLSVVMVIGGIGILLMALGAIATYIDGAKTWLENGVVVLELIGEALGKFVGSLISGVWEKVSDAFFDFLPRLGQSLSDFMTNLQPFIDITSSITGDLFKGLGIMLGVLLELGAAGVIQAIEAIVPFKTNYKDLQESLVGFADAMSAFQQHLGEGFDASLVEKAANAGLTLTQLMKNLQTVGNEGLWDLFTDAIFGDDLSGEQFKTQLTAFGEAIAAFGVALGDTDGSLVERAANAGLTLVSLMNQIGNQNVMDGVKKWFIEDILGQESGGYEKFTTNLVGFAEAIKSFANVAKDMPQGDVISKAVDMAKTLVGLQKNLPKVSTGGVLFGWFMTTTVPMDTFGTQLEAFANSMVNFTNIITASGIGSDSIQKCIDIAKSLTELANGLPKYDGPIKRWFTKDTIKMDTFGRELETFGTKVASFVDKIAGVNSDSVQKAKDVAQTVTELAKGLPSGNSVFGWIFGGNSQSLRGLGLQMEAFAVSMKAASKDLAKVNVEQINSLSSAISKLLNELNTAAKNTDTYSASMNSLGVATANGFINGVLSKLYYAASAGSQLGLAVKNSLKAALDIHSPSKVMEQLGGFTGQGFLNGLTNLIGQATVIFNNLKQVAINHFSGIIGDVVNAFNTGIDQNALTITPVLDLSNIQSGVGDISSMFGNIDLSSLNGSFDLASITSGSMNNFSLTSGTDSIAQAIYEQFKDFNAKDTIGNMTNTFNIQSSDPEGVAEEVSKILEKQVGRASAVWG